MTPLQRGFLATIIAAGLGALAVFACHQASADTLACAPEQVISITCTPVGVQPPPAPVGAPPSGCTLTASPATITAPSPVTLTSACTGGSPATAWTWSANAGLGSVAGGAVQVSATSTYTVTPANAYGAGNTASATVTLTSAPPPGPVDVATACAAAGFGAGHVKHVQMPWARFRAIPSQIGGMGVFDVVVVEFTTPATPNGTAQNQFVAAEYLSTTSIRTWSLSKTPCDFTASAISLSVGQATTAGQRFLVDDPALHPGFPTVPPGTTAWINVRNWGDPPGCSINGICDISLDFYPQY